MESSGAADIPKTRKSDDLDWTGIATTYDPIKIGSIDGTDIEPHDRGLIRAVNSFYYPNRRVKGRPECTLFVGRLSHKSSEDTLTEVFSEFGHVRRVRLVKDIVTGFPKGYAFVEFEHTHEAKKAYMCFKLTIDDSAVVVDYECERVLKGWKPRRLGGGFGGYKGSGQLRFGCRYRPFRMPLKI